MAEATATEQTGTVVSYTIIYVPTPEFAGEAPYGLAVIETPGGERLLVRTPGEDATALDVGATLTFDHRDEHGPAYRVR